MGGGGVSGTQKNTAAGGLADTAQSAADASMQQYARQQLAQNKATGFYGNRMDNGLPFFNNLTDYNSGTVAQAFAPQRAQILRQTSQYGTNVPSGYRDALLTSLGAQQGRAFDSTLTQAMMANEMAKQQGAQGITGQQQIAGNQALGYGSLASGANQAVLTGPARPTTWGTIGGLAMQGMQTAGDIAKAQSG